MRGASTIVYWLAGMLLLGMAGSLRADAPGAFAVIAASGSTHETLTSDDIAQIFLRKRNYWEDGTRIHPVNLPANAALRQLFSRSVLGGTPEEFDTYWRQQYFHGVLPPHVVASEQAMGLFVRSVPGAIGYVAQCIPTHGVEVLLMVGQVPRCPQ